MVERQIPDNPIEQLGGKRVLVVDEIDDTRGTLAFALDRLVDWGALSVGVAIVHNKIKVKCSWSDRILKTFGEPMYYNGEKVADQWIVYPWETVQLVGNVCHSN